MSEADIDWAWEVYQATTRRHIEEVADWSIDKQREIRLDSLRRGTYQAILSGAEGQRVGLVAISDQGTELSILHLELLPAAQGHGLGTAVIRSIVSQAAVVGKAVSLRVLHVNPGARALYERLGFIVVDQDDQSTQMRLTPSSGTGERPPSSEANE